MHVPCFSIALASHLNYFLVCSLSFISCVLFIYIRKKVVRELLDNLRSVVFIHAQLFIAIFRKLRLYYIYVLKCLSTRVHQTFQKGYTRFYTSRKILFSLYLNESIINKSTTVYTLCIF